jgi:hypothetical protein
MGEGEDFAGDRGDNLESYTSAAQEDQASTAEAISQGMESNKVAAQESKASNAKAAPQPAESKLEAD